jgi:hypothetical protein
VTFERVEGDRRQTRVEERAEAVAVGPTLVGVIAKRLAELRAGASVPVRLAVLDRLETIGFDLTAVDAAPGTTRVRMTPSSFVIAWVVDPITFTFDATGKLTQLEGRVPPKLLERGRLRDLDARVEYRYVTAGYR